MAKQDHEYYLNEDPKNLKENLTFAPKSASWPIRKAIQKIEKALGISYFAEIYTEIRKKNLKPEDFWSEIIKTLGISLDLTEEGLNNIPKSGPVIIVANHPYGAAEGTLLIELLTHIRKDFKVLVTETLYKIPEIQPFTLYLKIQGEKNAKNHNKQTIEEAKSLLNNNGLLVIFPAGEVSAAKWNNFKAVDPKWRNTVGLLVRETQADVLPIFFHGQNSWLFQTVSVLSKPFNFGSLRLALLPKEFLNRRNKKILTTVGRLISNKHLKEFESSQNITKYLRMRTYLLGGDDSFQPNQLKHLANKAQKKVSLKTKKLQPVAKAIDKSKIEAIILESLETKMATLLVEKEGFQAFYIDGKNLSPTLLKEIGRLREITFRDVNEGSGKTIDIDSYDDYYLHLLVWDKNNKQIAGAYRMGDVKNIFESKGINSIYCHSLFHFNEDFLSLLAEKNCLEMGRSFVTPDYQRSSALNVMWSAIAEYLLRNPEIKYFFGPVSISDAYKPLSKELILNFFENNYGADKKVKELVSPFHKFKKVLMIDPELRKTFNKIKFQELDLIIEDLEGKGRKIPPLMKYYTKILGAKFVGFSVDKDFNSVDGLIIVDINKISPRVMRSFLGSKDKENAFFKSRNIERIQ